MRTKVYAVILSIVFSVAILNAQASLTGKQIQQKSIEATRVAGVEAVATMTIIDGKGCQRVRKLAQISKLYDNGQTEKKLIRFLAPADVKGTGFLTFDYREKDDYKWLYMPALRKTRRIVSSENAKSFMGSEFSYADMTPPTVEDFTYNILGEEEINGILCWKIEITPNDDDITDESGFSKKISYIGKQDYVLRKAVYFDLDEELHKEFTVYEIKELDTKNHKYRLAHMVMENKQNGRQSIMKVEKIQFTPKVKDEYFTIRYLERE
jgi:hypothetical protein